MRRYLSGLALSVFVATSAIAATVVTPCAGPPAGGNTVTITGTGLTGATAVYFGDVSATIVSNTDTTITAASPAHTAGTVDVVVTTTRGSATATSSPFSFDVTYGLPDPGDGSGI